MIHRYQNCVCICNSWIEIEVGLKTVYVYLTLEKHLKENVLSLKEIHILCYVHNFLFCTLGCF